MKRSLGLITAGGFTTIVALVIFFLTLSTLVYPAQSNQAETPPTVESVVNQQVDGSQVEQINVAATAQAANQQIEGVIQEREATLKAEIAQRRQALTELDRDSSAKITDMEAARVQLQAQMDQATGNIQSTQANINALQQAIQDDDTAYQNQLVAMTNAEDQLRLELEKTTSQLNVAYNELTQRQALAQQAAARQAAAAAAAQHSAGRYDDDDDGGHHEDHNDDHDDDDDDDHDDDD